MNILICYHSQSGNTEKVARAMAEALASEVLTIKPAADVDPATIGNNDMILLGSGVYGGSVGASIKTLVKKAPTLPAKVVFFSTHANFSPIMWKDAFKLVRKGIEKAGSAIVAEWDCQGENRTMPEALRQSEYAKLTPEKRKAAEENDEKIRGRPNEEDLANARAFARSLLKRA
jgi:flavodoxin I